MDKFHQATLDALWSFAPDAILVVSTSGKIVRANHRIEQMLGWIPEELVGKNVDELVPKDSRSTHAKHRAHYAENPYARAMGEASMLSALRKDGVPLPVEISLTSFDLDEQRFILVIIRDARERFDYEEALRRLSFHDALTGLYNRAFLEEEIMRLEHSRMRPITVLAADLDGMKEVNDTRGHAAGDALLVRTARVLQEALRAEDVLARTGGDEFLALLPQVSESTAERVVSRIQAAMESSAPEPIQLSIGCATALEGETLRETMLRADATMYKAKRARKPDGAPIR